jgi:electron transport complex protein RnfB
MESADKVYRELQEHLDQTPEGFPAVPSGLDIKLLKLLFTESEARIAAHLSVIEPEPVEVIYRRLRECGLEISPEELQQTLSGMLNRGTILAYREGYTETRYLNAEPFAGGIFDFQVNRLTEELMQAFEQYHTESRSKAGGAGGKLFLPLRTIPVEKSIPVQLKHFTSTYEDVRALIQNAGGPVAVANCICRQINDLQGRRCQHTDLRETCLQIGTDHARQYVDMGIARFISKEEALEIVDKAQEAGLVLQPENCQQPEAICCCCGDCCDLLSMVKRAPRPAALYDSNYYVEVDPALCNGCQACVRNCHLGARVMVDNMATVDLDRCIGCGNCVTVCRPAATRLASREPKVVPPVDKISMKREMLSRKKGRR